MGRRDELDELAQKLQNSDQVAITALAGMGGIGKTALAQQYVREAKDEYPGGRWYFKVREQALTTQLVSAAAIFGWELPDGLTDNRARVQWCYEHWCRQYPGTRLLLLDDVQQYRDIRDFLPNDESFRVLLTSRRRFGKPVDRLDLGELPLNEALDLLTRLIDDPDRGNVQQAEATALCEWVGRLPLGLELMARYLALYPNLSFAKLQERLESKRLEAGAFRKASDEVAYDQLEDYEKPIEAAFELSWQDLEPDAKMLMGLLSAFAAAPIPLGLIVGALSEWDEEDLEELLDGVLVQRNLLQRDVDGSYQLHQLIREFVASKLKTELGTEKSALQKSVANSLTNFAKQIQQVVTVSARQVMSEVMPHMDLVAQGLSHLIENSTDVLWLFIGLGRFYESQSLWPEAENWYQSCLKMTEERFGSDHPNTATSLNNLAELYRSIGRYGEAEPLYTRSLEIRETQLGADHPNTATSLNDLALLYESMGRYGEAEPLYTRSVAIYETQLGADHPDTAMSLNNLALLYESMGRYGEAEPLYTRSLEIRETQLGADHPDTAMSLNNLASLYRSMGRYGEAEPLYTRSLEISETQLGTDHPNTATSLNNLAALYRSMGRYGEAEPLYTRSLEISETQLGADHPDTATSLNNLAALYGSMGRYGEAEPLYTRSLEISETQLGADHPNTATSLNNLAALYRSMGRYGEAEPLYTRSLEISETQLGADHPNTAISLYNVAYFYGEMSRYGEAEEMYVRALIITHTVLGQDHPHTTTFINNFVDLLKKVIEENQTEQLSDHPVTQAMLESLQSQ